MKWGRLHLSAREGKLQTVTNRLPITPTIWQKEIVLCACWLQRPSPMAQTPSRNPPVWLNHDIQKTVGRLNCSEPINLFIVNSLFVQRLDLVSRICALYKNFVLLLLYKSSNRYNVTMLFPVDVFTDTVKSCSQHCTAHMSDVSCMCLSFLTT